MRALALTAAALTAHLAIISTAWTCERDAQCSTGQVCELGRCQLAACSENRECGVSGQCKDHLCVVGGPSLGAQVTSKRGSVKYTQGVPGVWVTGVAVMGAFYLIGSIWGGATDNALGLVPLAGPVLAAGQDRDDSFTFGAGLVLTIFQGIGAYTALLGGLIKQRVSKPSDATSWMLLPGPSGAQVVGRF